MKTLNYYSDRLHEAPLSKKNIHKQSQQMQIKTQHIDSVSFSFQKYEAARTSLMKLSSQLSQNYSVYKLKTFRIISCVNDASAIVFVSTTSTE